MISSRDLEAPLSHSHGSSHGHFHGHAHGAAARGRALAWALGLNGGFLLIEAGVGWWTGSLALLSDAAHMLSDVAALTLAWSATRFSARSPTATQTFGLRRVEVLGGFVNALLMLGVVAWIVAEAVQRLSHEAPTVAGFPVMVVGLVGLGINLGSAWALWRADRQDLNIRGALIHMLADALGSVGAVAAAVLLMLGYPEADAAISLFIALMVSWGTWGLLRDSAGVLMQLPPTGFDVERLRAVLEDQAGVCEAHDVHVWTLDGRGAIVSAHLVAAEGADHEELRTRVSRALHRDLGVRHLTLQIESGSREACLADHGDEAPAPAAPSAPAHDHDHDHDHDHGHRHG